MSNVVDLFDLFFDLFRLDDEVAVVTGAGSGFGTGFARALASGRLWTSSAASTP
ncbi:hypothetical protein [Streptomyces geranii]|uniref:hypothetical protein n=1 Tax=Streptomyces geranii TaxID=2058923 RepID=UPI0018E59A64|nr:hypothetical protein [Streptomyces geranii]